MRGVWAKRVKDILVRFGFSPAEPWVALPSLGTRPDNIPTEAQRWDVERKRMRDVERESMRHHFEIGGSASSEGVSNELSS